MAASFPASVKTFTTKVDGVDDVQADHINDLQLEVTAVETDLIAAREGWTPITGACTFVSATTFTESGDKTGVYQPGTRFRCKQGGASYKYANVVSSSYSAPNTTVTLVGDALTSGAITDTYYSYQLSPVGFPDWFTWTPTLTGFSSNPGSSVYRYRITGRTCTVNINQNSDGTSNATTLTISAPVAARTLTSAVWYVTCLGRDNSTSLATPAVGGIISAGTSFSFSKDSASATWTASGGKRISAFQLSYEFA